MYQNYNPVAVPMPPGVFATVLDDVDKENGLLKQIPVVAMIKWLPVIHTTGYGNEPEEVAELCFTDAGAYALMGLDGSLYPSNNVGKFPVLLGYRSSCEMREVILALAHLMKNKAEDDDA